MNKYETLKHDMVVALKNGEKSRRITLADIVATIDKAATAGKQRVEITDTLVDEVLIKYEKTVQEMIDTCPTDEKYLQTRKEYLEKLNIVREYAPKVIDDIEEIRKMIYLWSCDNQVSIIPQNRGIVMKMIMPWLKENHCDMKISQSILKQEFEKNK